MSDTTTLYYYNGIPLPYDSLPDHVKQTINEARQAYEQKERESDYGYGPFVLVMAFFILLAYVAIKKAWRAKGTTILGSASRRYTTPEEQEMEARSAALHRDYYVYEGASLVFPEEQYEKTLNKHSPYYRRLSPELKERFLQRTKRFLDSKTFLLKTDEPFVEMPILISATAVQLTFGIEKYLLPHYQFIRVFQEEYFAKDSLRVLAGHVYGNTITLAWNHFLKGHEEYNDGVNLGLHEMAHALYFQLVEADTHRCREFTANFNKVLAKGTEVYESKQLRPSALFTGNAYRNLQEFWAETVELFFERPSELSREHGELYEILKDVLNQDPVSALYPVIAE